MPTTALRDSGLTDAEIHQFIKSFESIGDAFYFLGASTFEQVAQRARGANNDEVDGQGEGEGEGPGQGQGEGSAKHPSAPPSVPTVASTVPRPPLQLTHKHRPIVCFDTETTGLSPAIVCQLAYVVVENGAITVEYDQLLNLPPGARIGRQAQNVHGISNRDCNERGVDAVYALELLAQTCARILADGGRVVAHNSKFDVRALRETRLAHNVIDHGENQTLEDKNTFCTMANSKQYSPLKDKAGRTKVFKNEELYQFFYGLPPSWAKLHDALDDVMVTTLNYAQGLHRGWW